MCQNVEFMTTCESRGPTGDAGVDDGAGAEAAQPRRWRLGRSSMAAFRRGQLRMCSPSNVADIIYTFSSCRLYFLSSFFFPRLISAVADWMSTILAHMVWP